MLVRHGGEGSDGNPWQVRLLTPLHMTRDAVHFHSAAGPGLVPLWEAKHAPIATVPLATSRLALKRGGLNCWYTTPCKSCGGEVPHCHKLERVANLRDCVDCLN